MTECGKSLTGRRTAANFTSQRGPLRGGCTTDIYLDTSGPIAGGRTADTLVLPEVQMNYDASMAGIFGRREPEPEGSVTGFT